MLDIKQLPFDDKILSFDPFIEFVVVDIEQLVLHITFLFGVVVVELHFSQQELGVVVVLNFKLSALRNIANNFGCLARVDEGMGAAYQWSRRAKRAPNGGNLLLTGFAASPPRFVPEGLRSSEPKSLFISLAEQILATLNNGKAILA